MANILRVNFRFVFTIEFTGSLYMANIKFTIAFMGYVYEISLRVKFSCRLCRSS